MGHLIIFLINCYKWIISPLYTPTCRYTPSCSSYAKEAILEWGSFKGSLLAVKRILRCGPWGKDGYDPVPRKNSAL